MKYFAILLCLACSLGRAQTIPTDPGVYVENAGKWDKLFVASTSGEKSKGVAKTAFTGGIASAKVVMLYRDPDAPVKTQGPRPVFRIIGPTETAPRAIVIVRLEKKKDHRELQVATARGWTGANLSYPPDATTSVDVGQIAI